MFFRSPSTDSVHLSLGFPTGRVPSGLNRVSFLQGSSSCTLKRLPSDPILRIFITLIVLVHRTAYKTHSCILTGQSVRNILRPAELPDGICVTLGPRPAKGFAEIKYRLFHNVLRDYKHL